MEILDFKSTLSNDLIIILRKLLLFEEGIVRRLTVKILRLLIPIDPRQVTTLYKSKLIPVIVSKIFEDYKKYSFEEALECLKFMNKWLMTSEENFPLIFCQGLSALAKSQDEHFKRGSIEFIRQLAIRRPEYCSVISGFKILVNCLLDGNSLDYSENIFQTLLFLLNSEKHRKYLKNLSELFKIYSIFSKSDYLINPMDKEKDVHLHNEERNKLEVQLELSKRILLKLLKTWPGYSLLFGNYMALNSLINALNSDTSLIIKKTILDFLKELLEMFDNNSLDNFSTINHKDSYYLTKVYFAYILHGLKNNQLFENLSTFIEKENNPLIEYARQIRLKYIILYSKLSSIDLLLPELNKKKTEHMEGTESKVRLIDSNVKTMDLLEEKFQHFNGKEVSFEFDLKDLSETVVLAKKSLIFWHSKRGYVNQYTLDIAKKELFNMVDDSLLQFIIKSTNLSKDIQDWDWVKIKELMDILEYKKELCKALYLVAEINKQKIFKRLLFALMPSKGLYSKINWNMNFFICGLVGNKLFKILSSSQDGMRVLETSPEDHYFSSNKTWFEDLIMSLDQQSK